MSSARKFDPAHTDPAAAPGRTLKRRAAEAMVRFLIMFIYLWVFLGMLSLHERVVLRQEGIGWTAQTLAVVNAFVLGKVMLVVEDLRPARWMPPDPLLYPTLFEAAVMAVVFIAFHEVEEIVLGVLHGGTLGSSVPVVGGGGFVGLLLIGTILFVVLIPYLLVRNIGRVIGMPRMKQLLLGRRVAPA
ncbi:MAG: hypothetical protein JOZ05_12445 [Acetobacteraceae bacterium]|nr:hypothetical protein [Acetobacteraceae bacterium]